MRLTVDSPDSNLYEVEDCDGGQFPLVVEADDEEGYIVYIEHEIIDGRAFPLLYQKDGEPRVKHIKAHPEGGIVIRRISS